MSTNIPGGLAAAMVAVLSFGSNFVPLKKYKTGDGFFFQWVMCTGVFMTGLIFNIVWCSIKGQCPTFQPMAMLGGAIWCSGNIWVVPIVKAIGLSLGMLLWGTTNLLVGWATNKFGFGLVTPDSINNTTFNYAGVAVAVAGLFVFLFIKPTVEDGAADASATRAASDGAGSYGRVGDDDVLPFYGAGPSSKLLMGGSLNGGDMGYDVGSGAVARSGQAEEEEESWIDRFPPAAKSLVGIAMAVGSGLCYGSNFTPPQYVVDHRDSFPGASDDLRDYVFPHFCGIILASTFYMLLYAALRRNNPVVYPQIILPGFVSGVFWAIAQISWFFAGPMLGQSLAFPIISVGPGLVAALWGVFVFREIQGTRNYITLTAAFCLIVTANILIVFSKLD